MGYHNWKIYFGPSADSNSRCLDQKTPVLINCAIQAQYIYIYIYMVVMNLWHLRPMVRFFHNLYLLFLQVMKRIKPGMKEYQLERFLCYASQFYTLYSCQICLEAFSIILLQSSCGQEKSGKPCFKGRQEKLGTFIGT